MQMQLHQKDPPRAEIDVADAMSWNEILKAIKRAVE
jgi:hypothetical protein